MNLLRRGDKDIFTVGKFSAWSSDHDPLRITHVLIKLKRRPPALVTYFDG